MRFMHPFLLITAMLAFVSTASFGQANLSQKLSMSENQNSDLMYVDSARNGYHRGKVIGRNYHVLFTKVNFDKTTSTVDVEGVAAVFYNGTDTLGMESLSVMVAKHSNNMLHNIRVVTVTNDRDILDKTHLDGYFSFSVKIEKDDKLIFVSRQGTGLRQFALGSVCYEQ